MTRSRSRPHPLWLLAAAPLLLAAGAAVGSLRFPAFSIDPLPAAPAGELQAVMAMSMAPDATGFAANVNVMRQPWPGTLAAFDELSTSQFEGLGWRVTEREERPDELRYRYEGDVQGRPLRWFCRALKQGDAVYVVTATATPGRWKTDGEALDHAVDSFTLNR